MAMNMAQFNQLKGLLPDVDFEPSSRMIWPLRLVKSSREIAYMREACRIADKAIEAAIDAIQEGKTEKEVTMVMGITISCGPLMVTVAVVIRLVDPLT